MILYDPKFNESILDPACGAGTILIDSTKKVCHELKQLNNDIETKSLVDYVKSNIYGIDINSNLFWLTVMNMYFHGFGIGNIVLSDALDCIGENGTFFNRKFDLILTHPPVGFYNHILRIDPTNQIQFRRYEEIFLYLAINSLKPLGKLGIIIPNSILISRSSKKIRDYVKNETIIKAIISLPKNMFDIKCSLLFVEKKNGTDDYQDSIFVVNADKIKYNKFKQYSNNILEKYKEFSKNDKSSERIHFLDDKGFIYGIRGDLITSEDSINLLNFNYEYYDFEDKLDNIGNKITVFQISKRVVSGFDYKQIKQTTSNNLIPFIRISDIQNGIISFKNAFLLMRITYE